jgi:hypothetical protein
VTKYPRAQNLWPRKFRILLFCEIHIELFPFMYPMICATEYLGGIDISIWTFGGSPGRLHDFIPAAVELPVFAPP